MLIYLEVLCWEVGLVASVEQFLYESHVLTLVLPMFYTSIVRFQTRSHLVELSRLKQERLALE